MAPSLPAFTLVGLPDAVAGGVPRPGPGRGHLVGPAVAQPAHHRQPVARPRCPRPGPGSTSRSPWRRWRPRGRSTRPRRTAWSTSGSSGLDGRLRPVRGVLPAVAAAVAAGLAPGRGAAGERGRGAAGAGRARSSACTSLARGRRALRRRRRGDRGRARGHEPRRATRGPSGAADLADVVGQDEARGCARGRRRRRAPPAAWWGRRARARRCWPRACPGLLPDLVGGGRGRGDRGALGRGHVRPRRRVCCAGRRSRTRTTPPRPRASWVGVRHPAARGGVAGAPRACCSSTRRPSSRPRSCRRCGSRSSTASSCSTEPRAPPGTRPGSSWSWPPTRARAGRRCGKGARVHLPQRAAPPLLRQALRAAAGPGGPAGRGAARRVPGRDRGERRRRRRRAGRRRAGCAGRAARRDARGAPTETSRQRGSARPARSGPARSSRTWTAPWTAAR